MADINETLRNIQSNLKAPKGQFNDFGKYKYRSCEDILEAVKPLLLENKAILTITDEIMLVGARYYVKAAATLTTIEGSLTVTAYAREEESKKGMDGSQVTGAASSYARKYALNGLFCIDDNKDSDYAPEDKPNKSAKQPEAPVSYVCSKCGKTIEETIVDGKKYTAQKIQYSTMNKFGKVLCMECAKEEKNAK